MLCVPLARARKTLAVCAAWRPFLLQLRCSTVDTSHSWSYLAPTAWDVWLELPKQDQTKTRAVKTSAIATGFCQIRCGDFSKSCQKRHRLREPQLLRDLPTAGLGGAWFGLWDAWISTASVRKQLGKRLGSSLFINLFHHLQKHCAKVGSPNSIWFIVIFPGGIAINWAYLSPSLGQTQLIRKILALEDYDSPFWLWLNPPIHRKQCIFRWSWDRKPWHGH